MGAARLQHGVFDGLARLSVLSGSVRRLTNASAGRRAAAFIGATLNAERKTTDTGTEAGYVIGNRVAVDASDKSHTPIDKGFHRPLICRRWWTFSVSCDQQVTQRWARSWT